MASLKSNNLFIQVPSDASIAASYPDDLIEAFLRSANNERPSDTKYTKNQITDMLKKSITVQSAERTIVFVDWVLDDLNQNIVVFEKSKSTSWTSEWLVVSDICP